MYLLGLAVEVARFSLPVLPFAFVGRQLDGVPVCQLKRLVDIQDALDIIIPGRNVFQAVARIAQRRRVPPRRGAGREPVHIHAESLLRLPREAELKPRLRLLLGRDYKHHVPVQRRRARLFGKRDLKTLGRHQRPSQYSPRYSKPQDFRNESHVSSPRGNQPAQLILLSRSRPREPRGVSFRSEEHTSELQSLRHLVCRLLLEKKTQ